MHLEPKKNKNNVQQHFDLFGCNKKFPSLFEKDSIFRFHNLKKSHFVHVVGTIASSKFSFPMSDGRISEQIKKFSFTTKSRANGDNQGEHLEILIPELLQASYSFYTWPSAPILAWFLWEHRSELRQQRVLELGSGTALPGILAAKCGAQVTLTDSSTLPKSLAHIERCCQLNNLIVNRHIRVIGLTWGLFLNNIFNFGPLDLILGSDCFYEPSVFEDIVATVSYLLEINPSAKFLCTYQERSSDWSIEHLLTKWDLTCSVLNINNLGADSGLDVHELTGDHSIHLLEITHI